MISAMGRGFRNIWLLPFVHRRLSDRDPSVVAAALNAAGGLGFPALEEAVAGVPRRRGARRRRCAGRDRRARPHGRDERGRPARAARSPATTRARRPPRSPRSPRSGAPAGARRRPSCSSASPSPRSRSPRCATSPSSARSRCCRCCAGSRATTTRICACSRASASRALKAERDRDAGERFLVALSEPDRAVRAVLARRLRTLPVAEVLEQAEVLLADDAAGVVQMLGELREPEVTRYLLALAGRADLPVAGARARGRRDRGRPRRGSATRSAQLACSRRAGRRARGRRAGHGRVRQRRASCSSASARSRRAAEAELRGAFLWALQLAVRPGALGPATGARDRARSSRCSTTPTRRAPARRLRRRQPRARRARARAGRAARRASRAPTCGSPRTSRSASWRRPAVVPRPRRGRAREKPIRGARRRQPRAGRHRRCADPAALDVAPLAGADRAAARRADPRVREAAVRLAGLAGGRVPAAAIARLAGDPVPAVRAAALTALGRLGEPGRRHRREKAPLEAAFHDADPALHERAAGALLAVGGRRALAQVIAFVAGDGDADSRAAIAAAHHHPAAGGRRTSCRGSTPRSSAIDADDPASSRCSRSSSSRSSRSAAPARSIRRRSTPASRPRSRPSRTWSSWPASTRWSSRSATAESLYRERGRPERRRSVAADHAVDEGARELRPRVARPPPGRPAARSGAAVRLRRPLWSAPGRLTSGWSERWRDPVEVGGARVDIPVRALPNALRELQEHRRKRLDSPLSVTEWARLMVLFAVDHPSGIKNLFKLPVKSADQSVRARPPAAHAGGGPQPGHPSRGGLGAHARGVPARLLRRVRGAGADGVRIRQRWLLRVIRDVARRDVVGQPDAVVRAVKDVAGAVHGGGRDAQHHR